MIFKTASVQNFNSGMTGVHAVKCGTISPSSSSRRLFRRYVLLLCVYFGREQDRISSGIVSTSRIRTHQRCYRSSDQTFRRGSESKVPFNLEVEVIAYHSSCLAGCFVPPVPSEQRRRRLAALCTRGVIITPGVAARPNSALTWCRAGRLLGRPPASFDGRLRRLR